MTSHEVVTTLVTALHTNIDSIHATLQSLSSHPTHEAELHRLASEREAKIFDLRTAHAQALQVLANQRLKEQDELEAKRQKEAEDLEEQRKKEWEEVLKRREREDEERKERIRQEEDLRDRNKRQEDECREAEREQRELKLAEDIEKELERVEDEIEAKVEEGKKALRELDEKRRAINAEIDKALNMPTVIPKIQYRSRTRTLSRAGTMEQASMPDYAAETTITPVEKSGIRTPEPGAWLGKGDAKNIVDGMKDLSVAPNTETPDATEPLPQDINVNKNGETALARSPLDISQSKSPNAGGDRANEATAEEVSRSLDGVKSLPKGNLEAQDFSQDKVETVDYTANEILAVDIPIASQTRESSQVQKSEHDSSPGHILNIDDTSTMGQSNGVTPNSLGDNKLTQDEDSPSQQEDELSEENEVDEQLQLVSHTPSTALEKGIDLEAENEAPISDSGSSKTTSPELEDTEREVSSELKDKFLDANPPEVVLANHESEDNFQGTRINTETPTSAQETSFAGQENGSLSHHEEAPISSRLHSLPQTDNPAASIEESESENPTPTTVVVADGDQITARQDTEFLEVKELGDQLHISAATPMKIDESKDIPNGLEHQELTEKEDRIGQHDPNSDIEAAEKSFKAEQLDTESRHSSSATPDIQPSLSEDSNSVVDSGDNHGESPEVHVKDQDEDLPENKDAVEAQVLAQDQDHDLEVEHDAISLDLKNENMSENSTTKEVRKVTDVTEEHPAAELADVDNDPSIELERSVEQTPDAETSMLMDSASSKNAAQEPSQSISADAKLETDVLHVNLDENDESHSLSTGKTEVLTIQPEHPESSSSILEKPNIEQTDAESIAEVKQEDISRSTEVEQEAEIAPLLDAQASISALEVLPGTASVDAKVEIEKDRDAQGESKADEKSFEEMYPELQIRNLDAPLPHTEDLPEVTDDTSSHLNQDMGSSSVLQSKEAIQDENPKAKPASDVEQSNSSENPTIFPSVEAESGHLENENIDLTDGPGDQKVEHSCLPSDIKEIGKSMPVIADPDVSSLTDEPIKSVEANETSMAISDVEANNSQDAAETSQEHESALAEFGNTTSPPTDEQLESTSAHDVNGTLDTVPTQDATLGLVGDERHQNLGDDEEAPESSERGVSAEQDIKEIPAGEVNASEKLLQVNTKEEGKAIHATGEVDTTSQKWIDAPVEPFHDPARSLNNDVAPLDVVVHPLPNDYASDIQILDESPQPSAPVVEDLQSTSSQLPDGILSTPDTPKASESLEAFSVATPLGESPEFNGDIDNVAKPQEKSDSLQPVEVLETQSSEDHLLSPLLRETPDTGSAFESTQITPVASSDNLIKHELESQAMMLPAKNMSEGQISREFTVEDAPQDKHLDHTSSDDHHISSTDSVNGTRNSTDLSAKLHLPPSISVETMNEDQDGQLNNVNQDDESQVMNFCRPGFWPSQNSRDLILDHSEDGRSMASTAESQDLSFKDHDASSFHQENDEDHRLASSRDFSSSFISQESMERDTSWRATSKEIDKGGANGNDDDEPWPLRDGHGELIVNGGGIHQQENHHDQDDPSVGSDNWSESEHDDAQSEPEQHFGSLRPNPIHRMTNEDEYLPRSARDNHITGNDSDDNMTFEEKYGVPRPTTPIRSLSRMDNHLESPHTVQDADDLFEEDESEDDDHSERDPRDSYPEDLADQYFQRAETPLEVVPEHEPLTEFNDTYASHRSSGLFANLVDTVRSDIPAVRQAQLNNHQPGLEYTLGNGTRPRAVSFEDDEPEYAPTDVSQREPSLHVRTHTADTIPSFDSYAQSDSIPTTPSETSSSPFMEDPHIEPIIRDSGRERGMTETSQPAHDLTIDSHKEQAFDPAFPNTYPSFVSPKTSYANLDEEVHDRSSAGYGSFGAQRGLEAHRAEMSPTKTIESKSSVVPGEVETTQLPSMVGNNPFKKLPASPKRPDFDENKTPTTESPFQATRILPRTPPRLSINSQTSPSPVPLTGSPSPSPGLSKRPPPSVPTGSPGSLFAKTRSVFELASPQGSPALTPSPITALSAIRHSSSNSPPPPPPPRRSIGSRPSSLHISEPVKYEATQEKSLKPELEDDLEEEAFMPRSLDGNNKPPSPVFVPARSGSVSSLRKDDDPLIQKRNSNPFLGTFSRLVGSVQGLDDSVHNPARQPLLKGRDEY